jgi:hypothetical protein
MWDGDDVMLFIWCAAKERHLKKVDEEHSAYGAVQGRPCVGAQAHMTSLDSGNSVPIPL